MKKILFTGLILAAIPFVSFAQTAATGTVATTTPPAPTTVTPATPGLLPGDFFYFLDRWGEAFNMFLTFNKESKARLNLEYAKERAAEIKEVLKDPRRKLSDVEDAKKNYDEHLAAATATVKEEKDNGKDVSELARELDDELDVSHSELKDAYKEHEDRTSQAEAELRAKIAALPAGDPQIEGLTKALEAVINEKEGAQNENSDIEKNVSEKQSTFEDAMGPRISAEKHLEQVMRLRDFRERMGEMPFQFSTTSQLLMKQAQEAMMRGDYETAKRLSKEAQRGLEQRDGDNENIDERSKDTSEGYKEEGRRMMEGRPIDGTTDLRY